MDRSTLPARPIAALAMAAAAAIAILVACATPSIDRPRPDLVVETSDGQEIAVECRTDLPLSHGDCVGWAVRALRGDPDRLLDVTGAAWMVLTGEIRPGPDQDRCTADVFDSFGRQLRSVPVRCYVPSGG